MIRSSNSSILEGFVFLGVFEGLVVFVLMVIVFLLRQRGEKRGEVGLHLKI
jgi:hypothetical protein